MSEIVNQTLQKIAKGTGRIILVRFTTQTEYGIYSLAFVIISIFVIISTLGLSEGSTRYITYFNFMGRKKVLYGYIHKV